MTERCGKWMQLASEPCARPKGHNGPCRSKYDMDNARYMRTGRRG